MKKYLLGTLLGLAIAGSAVADVGTVKNGFGKLFTESHFTVVKKALKKGEALPRHNHEGDEIVFTVIKGKIDVVLNDSEKHTINVGDVLNFNGKNFIQGTAAEDTEILVTLVGEHKAGEHKH